MARVHTLLLALTACVMCTLAGVCAAPVVTDACPEECGGTGRLEPIRVRPRRPAPRFDRVMAVAPDESFKRVSLSDYEGQWLVLFFFPFAFTFVCPTEIVAFSDVAAELRALNTSVVGVSTDSHHTHLAWRRTPREDGGLGHLDIDLVGDFSKQISRDYGVLVDDPADEMYGAALRGLFIIDPKGDVRSVQINDDAVGRSVDEVVRLVRAFQYVGAHAGQVCPVNWHPGDDTITATHDGAEAFFRAAGIDNAAGGAEVPPAELAIRKDHVTEDVAEVCLRIGMPAELPEVFGQIAKSDLKVTQIGGGITNKLFKCDSTRAGAEGTVLVRWFGENTEMFIDREREADVMRQLTEFGFGCPALGYFSNGRIETFLHGFKALDTADFGTPFVTEQVATHVGRMHRLPLRGDKQPVLFATLRKWVALAGTVTLKDPAAQAKLQKDLPSLQQAVEWLEQAASNVPSLLVPAHNDLLPANVMRKGDEISLIDFEYSDFNPRGFDIANHFCEFTGFECDFERLYPSKETRWAFYEKYLTVFHEGTGKMPTGPNKGLEMEAMMRRLEGEVKFYSLASNLYWGVWGILQEAFSTIPFDYLGYSARRIARYHVEKAALSEHMHVGL